MKKTFTLIELLVVIAIIGILASLLLPSLGKARKKSQTAVCTSNLKQINNAVIMYIDDNDAYYPINYANGTGWDDLLSAYDGRNLTNTEMTAGGKWGPIVSDVPNGNLRGELYRCPLDTRVRTDEYMLKSYSHTQYFRPNNDWGRGRGISGFTVGGGIPISAKMSSINSSSETIAFTELADADLSGSNDRNHLRSRLSVADWWGGIQATHQSKVEESHHPQNKFNYSMVDGSVSPLIYLQTLLRSDGTMATASDVQYTIWDATK